jgi:hypothetical protein
MTSAGRLPQGLETDFHLKRTVLTMEQGPNGEIRRLLKIGARTTGTTVHVGLLVFRFSLEKSVRFVASFLVCITLLKW